MYEELIEAAGDARDRAYVPYSGFRVGAALLAKSGRVYIGCNIENVAYSPTMCAERVALGSAIAAGEPLDSFEALAVVGSDEQPSTPCGVCRQVLAELAPHVLIILAGAPELSQARLERTVDELLPEGFTFKGNKQ